MLWIGECHINRSGPVFLDTLYESFLLLKLKQPTMSCYSPLAALALCCSSLYFIKFNPFVLINYMGVICGPNFGGTAGSLAALGEVEISWWNIVFTSAVWSVMREI